MKGQKVTVPAGYVENNCCFVFICLQDRNDRTAIIKSCAPKTKIYVVVNFLSPVIFVFLLFWRMVMYANEVETKEK